MNQLGSHGVNVVLSIVLTYFIDPSEFGLFAMVIILTDFSHVLTNLGFGQALVHKKDVTVDDYNTVFWINVLMAVIISLILLIAASSISDFYSNPSLKEIILFIPLGYLFSSFGLVSQYLLIKKLRYKEIFFIYVTSRIISGITAIYLAHIGYGIWSLLIQHIFTSFLIFILSVYAHPWSLRLKFSIKSYREFKTFSFSIFGNESTNYLIENIDKALIGKFLSDVSLGLYSRAYSLAMLPVNNFSRVVDKFLFPYLSKSEFDLNKMKTIYLKWISAMSYAFVPIMFGVIFFSKDFVYVFFNQKWFEMVDMMRVIAIAGIFIAFTEINTSFLLNLNKAKELFRINLASRIVIILGVILTVKDGVIPVAYSLVVTNGLRFIVVHSYIFSKIQFSLQKYFEATLKPFLLSAISIGAILGMFNLFIVDQNHLRLLISILLFPITYLILSKYFNASCQKMILIGILNSANKNK